MEKFCIVILVFQILKPMRKYIKEVCKLDLRFGYERNRLNFSGAWGRIWIILSLVLISPFSIAQNQQIANSEFYTEASFCQIDQIQTPSTIIPFIGRDSSNMPFQLEADQIDVPKEHERAVTAALGLNLQLVITEQPQSVDKMLSRLSQDGLGKASIVSLELLRQRGGAIPPSDIPNEAKYILDIIM